MKDLPYMVITRKAKPEALRWCEEHIGERWQAVGRRTGNWTTFWAGRENPRCYKWYFRNEKDAFIFGLRWQ